jgi:hypothetical protein
LAGDWIKFELATLDKPEVIAMADLLGATTYDTVGRLLRVWGWFDQQTRNGNAVSVTGSVLKRYIDTLSGSQGFAASMQQVGWLNDDGVPNFDRHNGKPAKDRALTNNRVKRIRNGDSVTESLPEKRREEKNPIAPSPKFAMFWDAYPSRRRLGKGKCLALWTAKGFEAVGDQIALHVAAMCGTPDWQKEEGKYVPSALTYLNQRRFEDGVPEAPRPRLVV